MELLVAKWQPKDNLTSAELKAKLNEVSMNDDENPEVFADAFPKIRALYRMA